MSHIATAFILFNLVVGYALDFISPPRKISRCLAVIIAGCLLTYNQFALASSIRNRFPFAALLMVHWYLFLRAISLLLLPQGHPSVALPQETDISGQHKFKNNIGVQNASSNVLALVQRLAISLGDLWSVRTYPRAINHIPSFSHTDKSYVPTRLVFLSYAVLKVAASWAIFYLADYAPPSAAEIEGRFTRRHEKTFSRLSEISVEEFLIRSAVLVSAGLGVWAAATMVHSTMAIIFVGCGVSSPSSWPPLFGSLREAYTLRRFWGITWHQIFRMPLEDTSEFLIYQVLCLPKRTLTSRFSNVMFAFLLSGVAHYLADIVRSGPARDSGSLTFFALQPLAIMAEETVQALLYRRYLRQGPWARWVGYLWVGVFFLWSGPGFVYPTVRSLRPGVDFNTPHSMF